MSDSPSFLQRAVNRTWSALYGQAATPARSVSRRVRGAPASGRRTYAAAKVDTPTLNFLGSDLSSNEEIRRSLPRLRARSRQLCMDNDYARRFIHMVEVNVVGPNGINLQCQFKDNNGKHDAADNQLIEAHWARWGRMRECSADGRLSWRDIQALAIKTIARDGEVLIQKIRDRQARYGIRLRVMECDHLDVNHNDTAPNGNRIVMGIELDNNDVPLAYHLSDRHPGGAASRDTWRRRRVPAKDILHLFICERPGQLRGVPWMHTAVRRLNMLGGYEEAEVIAARLAASKMGAYISAEGEGPTPATLGADSADDDDGSDYDLVEEVEPGLIQTLPAGMRFEAFDPQHPNSAYESFVKGVLRGASSGMNVSYHSLGNDLEGVNLSSIRAGTLEERDMWRVVQCWLSEHLHDQFYAADWLPWQVDFGALKMLPAEKIDSKFSAVTWWPRGWHWIDPLKDTKAAAEEYRLGTTSLTAIARTKGRDIRDVFAERRAELDMAKNEFNLTVGITAGDIEINDIGGQHGEENDE